jgi:DNA polymerase
MSEAENSNETPAELPPAEAAALLKWYVEAGADEAIGEEPINRFTAPEPARAPAKPAAPSATNASVAARPASAPASAEGVASAQSLAAECKSLDDLRAAVTAFEGCGLKHTAHSTVFADGNPNASLMLVGEAPGRDEDRQGMPFVGQSGQLLDKMMAAIGRERHGDTPDNSVYIANLLPWRPPGNRNPSLEEIALCLPFLRRHIELVQPKVIIALGGISAKNLLETPTGIMKLRGRWGTFQGSDRPYDCMPTLHPAYLLSQPGQKKYAWADLLSVKEKLDSY